MSPSKVAAGEPKGFSNECLGFRAQLGLRASITPLSLREVKGPDESQKMAGNRYGRFPEFKLIRGTPLGSQNKDYNILGSILGPPYLWKLPFTEVKGLGRPPKKLSFRR